MVADSPLPPAVVRVRVLDPDDDAESVEKSTAFLRRALLEPGIWDVTAEPGGPPPPGSRAVDPAVLGGLLVGLAGAPATVEPLVTYVLQWLRRDPVPRSVEMSVGGDRIVVSGIDAADQRELIALWIARQGSRRG